MDSRAVREKYLKFFIDRGHKMIDAASLIPQDNSTLFISAGMQPLIPYLMGRKHPQGKRLVGVQRCLRTDDIDEVGDNTHHTFFEMLGNWSLGDYFKKESINFSFEFLTSVLNIPKDKLSVTVFAGDKTAAKDRESINIWKSLGFTDAQITPLSKKDNWWGPVQNTGPCGPDTEIFYWTGEDKPQGNPSTDSRWVEIWNNVFMEFNQTADGKLQPLPQKSVDTGMGVERTVAVLNGLEDNYQSDLFLPIIQAIETLTGKKYVDHTKWIRRIADHIRAAVFIISAGVEPSNTHRGYILRRLLRKALRYLYKLEVDIEKISEIVETVISLYTPTDPDLKTDRHHILEVVAQETEKFRCPINDLELYRYDLEAAITDKMIKKIGATPIINSFGMASGEYVFENFQSWGVPPDLAEEISLEMGLQFDKAGFEKALKQHQQKSRTASSGAFKGGLQSTGETETKYHTATHLLHAALRKIVGKHLIQRGSNITRKRLRFDFSHHQKLTQEQLKQVKESVNQKIQADLPVTHQEMTKEEAINTGAVHAFREKYSDHVTVYSIGDFSKEFCGGPHVKHTGVLGIFKIEKEESAGAGIRRIYATLS